MKISTCWGVILGHPKWLRRITHGCSNLELASLYTRGCLQPSTMTSPARLAPRFARRSVGVYESSLSNNESEQSQIPAQIMFLPSGGEEGDEWWVIVLIIVVGLTVLSLGACLATTVMKNKRPPPRNNNLDTDALTTISGRTATTPNS